MTALLNMLILFMVPWPYAVERSPLRRAPVTIALVIVNLIIFAMTHVSLHGFVAPNALYEQYGVTPALLTPLTLVTYTFMHLNGTHVLWNMLYLFLFGPIVEARIGSGLYTLLYFFGGAAAGVIDSLIVLHTSAVTSASYIPLVGASGAISAILGLYAAFAGHRLLRLFWPAGAVIGRGWHLLEIPSGFVITLWVVQTLYGAAMSYLHPNVGGVAYFAHLGGLAFGAFCGFAGGLSRDVDHLRAPRDSSGVQSAKRPVRIQRSGEAGSSDIVKLLERSVGEGDFARASALFAKCRATGASMPPSLLKRLGALARENGDLDQEAQILRMSTG